MEEAFEHAAEATFGIALDLAAVHPTERLSVAFDEADPEFALVTWLNLLLAEARCAGLALGRFSLRREGDTWHGEAAGEPWRPGVPRGVEVKGATLTMLAVRPTPAGWEARCVVDV